MLLTNQSLVVPLGSSPEISVIIAIDSDGTRSQQDNVTNSLVFTHTGNSGAVVNMDGLEQDPVKFQLYHYTFPPVQTDSAGNYIITSGLYACVCIKGELFNINTGNLSITITLELDLSEGNWLGV